MAAIDATAALAFHFSSKLSPFHAVQIPTFPFPSSSSNNHLSLSTYSTRKPKPKLKLTILASTSSSFSTPSNLSTKLYVSGLSLELLRRDSEMLSKALVSLLKRIDQEALRFSNTLLRRSIEGMHGKFLDGRVIFVEVAKPRSPAN